MTILPCLMITGHAHDAGVVLHLLRTFCRRAALLAGIRRSDLGVLRWGSQTNLISEPNALTKRTATLLSGLTDRNTAWSVEGGSVGLHYSKSLAIYAGMRIRANHKIQHSIHIHITATNAAPPTHPEWMQEMIKRLPIHLSHYREEESLLV